jgi:hypothetical protein
MSHGRPSREGRNVHGMNVFFGLLAAVACAHDRAPSAPLDTVAAPARVIGPPSPYNERAAAPAAETELYRSDSPTSDPHISNQVEPREAGVVLASLFPSHLTNRTQCPRPFFVPDTWSGIDALQDKNMAAGRFVPVIEQRLDASFTAPGARESLFVIGIDNCQANTIDHHVLAIFPTAALTGSPKATLRWDEHETQGAPSSFVALVQGPGERARLLAANGRLIELNRDFGAKAPDSGPAVAPWTEIERAAAPAGCFALTASLERSDGADAQDGAVHQTVHVTPCRTP